MDRPHNNNKTETVNVAASLHYIACTHGCFQCTKPDSYNKCMECMLAWSREIANEKHSKLEISEVKLFLKEKFIYN
jgi:hypothetical protein